MAENKKYLDMPGLTYFYNQIKSKFASKTDVSTPLTASTIAAMTDHDKVYVYTGSETGHTFGDWYYYEDGSWHSAGQYRANVYETDKTLSVADKPADGKKTGDEIADLKSALTTKEEIDSSEFVNLSGYYIGGSPPLRVFRLSGLATMYVACLPNTTYNIQKIASNRFTVAYTTDTPVSGMLACEPIHFSAAKTSADYTTGDDAAFLCVYYKHSTDTISEGEIFNSIKIYQQIENVLLTNKKQYYTDTQKKQARENIGCIDGISDSVKTALLNCFMHVAWVDHDHNYYSILSAALQGRVPPCIEASFDPGSHIVIEGDALSSLTPYLTVKYYADENSDGEIVSSDDYVLSGSIEIGDNNITVQYNNYSCTVLVTAADFYNVFVWNYLNDGSGNLKKISKDAYDYDIGGSLRGVFTGSDETYSKTRTFVTERGKAPMRINSSPYNYFTPYMYPVPIPKTATRAVLTVTPNNYKIFAFVFKYLNNSNLTQYDYDQITSVIEQVGTATLNFSAQENLFLAMYVNNSNTTNITIEPEFSVVFS